MTNEELACAIRDGNHDYCPVLWAQVEKFVAMQAGKAYRRLEHCPWADECDFYQSGYLAMMEAVKTFDGSSSFLTWLGYYLKSAFATVGGYRTAKEKASPLRYAVSLDAPLSDDGDMTLLDTLQYSTDAYEATEDAVFNEQLHDALEEALQALETKQADIMQAYYFEGRTMPEIAEEQGCSHQYVAQKQREGLRRLRHPKISRELRPYIEAITCFYRPAGAERFRSTHTSAVEEVVLWRERMAERGTMA